MDQEKLSLLVGLLSPSLENMGRCFTTNNVINDASTCIFQTIHVHVHFTECYAGLSLRAGGRGFPPATQSMAPGYFRR